jgi:hypothetical protein
MVATLHFINTQQFCRTGNGSVHGCTILLEKLFFFQDKYQKSRATCAGKAVPGGLVGDDPFAFRVFLTMAAAVTCLSAVQSVFFGFGPRS